MSNFLATLYVGLGLPYPSGKKLSANYNKLTRKVDGNTDSNNDGVIDKKDKNGFVEPEELHEEVFGNRKEYALLISQLRIAGLEDPFEETPEIKSYVQKLFKRYEPTTELNKARLLFASIIPPSRKFKLGEVFYRGLTRGEGGLAIPFYFEKYHDAPLRIKYGDLLPKELINASPEERIALCLEYSHLLVSLLRMAGIEAHTKGEPNHVYVIAILEGRKYRMDAAMLLFEPAINGASANTDRESVAMHYSNEGNRFCKQLKFDEAIEAYNKALEINPNFAIVWNNKAVAIYMQGGKPEEAIKACNRALEINPNLAEAWLIKAYALHEEATTLVSQGKTGEAIKKLEEAIPCYNKALSLYSNPAAVWDERDKSLLLMQTLKGLKK